MAIQKDGCSQRHMSMSRRILTQMFQQHFSKQLSFVKQFRKLQLKKVS